MKKFKLATIAAAALLANSAALAGQMYIDVGSNAYDNVIAANDADSTTGMFTEFGFSQLLATSVYDFSDGSIFGSFYDTNILSELDYANVPASGTALDGSSTVNLATPNCAGGQCDIDALSPLAPPLGSDNEGFLTTWDLQVAYHFDGTLTGAGPDYTSGFFDIYFNDLNDDSNDRKVLTGTLTGSTINAANLDLWFDITFAETGFLFAEMQGTNSFMDVASLVADGKYAKFHLDTNVNPPIPTADQLLLVADDGGNTNAIRQTTLDGSIATDVPEPSTLALFGGALLALAGFTRRRKAN